MDWPRYVRSQEAAAIEAVERRRRFKLAGNDIELTATEWRMVEEHDALVGDDDTE